MQRGETRMPELPEVEVVRRDLEREVIGKKIKSTEVHGMRTIRRYKQRKQFTSLLDGRTIKGVDRKGKYILMRLDDGEVLIVHLGMSGQLLRAKGTRDPVVKHTHVVFTFTQGGQLRFIDPRTFGEMFVAETEGLDDVDELSHLGIDPLETALNWEYFGQLVAQRHAKLKLALMDQKFMAGIGNIYSDEIMFNAGLRWDRMSDELSPEEVRRLYRAVIETLQDAVKFRGSSLADEQYVDLFGKKGGYQEFHKVYAREGQACQRCRGTIVREKVSGRSTFYCPSCQV
jgi:formamidopyrimidine-DNA glycosylase